jgi:hypothetical protein
MSIDVTSKFKISDLNLETWGYLFIKLDIQMYVYSRYQTSV